MELNGSVFIPADRSRVWAALNDAEILKRCIPGCEELVWEGPDQLKATVAIKVGPVQARFGGLVRLSERQPPESCLLEGEGQGGAAGFAKGSAQVQLVPENDGTRLDYRSSASVGGKLAQIGGRLVDAAASKLANDFFQAFQQALTEAAPAQTTADATATMDAPSPSAAGRPSWIGPAVTAALAALLVAWLILH